MSTNKAKGTRYESALVTYLNSFGLHTYRPAQAGAKDTGDIHGLPGWAIQAKDWQNVTNAVREGVDGAETQRLNLGAKYAVAFVKRARKPISHGYAVMRIDRFVELLADLMPEQFDLEGDPDASE